MSKSKKSGNYVARETLFFFEEEGKDGKFRKLSHAFIYRTKAKDAMSAFNTMLSDMRFNAKIGRAFYPYPRYKKMGKVKFRLVKETIHERSTVIIDGNKWTQTIKGSTTRSVVKTFSRKF